MRKIKLWDDKRKLITAMLAVSCLVLFGVWYLINRRAGDTVEVHTFNILNVDSRGDSTVIKAIKVHVAGEVRSPGVYEMAADARVEDAVDIAGGFTDEADESSVNMAAYMKDGQQVLVRHIGEKNTAANKKAQNENLIININTAAREELTLLPGVGEVIADSIIIYREDKGEFVSVEEIKNVPRIGESLYSQIKNRIVVD